MVEVRSSPTLRTIPFLIAVCFLALPARAKYSAGGGMAAFAETSTYVFLLGQSTVVQTGGIAGVRWTYSVKGQFQLTIDRHAGAASFARCDVTATDDSPFKRTLDLTQVFNPTLLVGTVVDDTTIQFTGKASDASDIRITVTLQDDLARLIGKTTPPPNSTDFFIFNLDAVAQRKYSGGGTAQDPYQIATATNLILLGENPADYDKHFVLTADIDLDPSLPGRRVFDKAVIAPDTDPTKYWFQGTAFTGVLDGKGHTISHLTIKGNDYLGLFGRLASLAEVKNLGVVDVNIVGSGDYVGYVGGLVGENWGGTVTQCHSTGAVSGNSWGVGGLVGGNDFGSLTQCYSTGIVSGRWCVGGLVGSNTRGSVTNCYSTGAVNGTEQVGGLVGWNDVGTVTQCYSTGVVSGKEAVGGLVGENDYDGTVTQCYSTGAVSGGSYVGGLVGDNYDGSVTNCYSTGVVNAGGNNVGGLVGDNEGNVINCFWDTETSGQAKSDGGTGKTTVEMQTARTFLNGGWDFISETANGAENIWWILEGKDYPHLWWELTKEANTKP